MQQYSQSSIGFWTPPSSCMSPLALLSSAFRSRCLLLVSSSSPGQKAVFFGLRGLFRSLLFGEQWTVFGGPGGVFTELLYSVMLPSVDHRDRPSQSSNPSSCFHLLTVLVDVGCVWRQTDRLSERAFAYPEQSGKPTVFYDVKQIKVIVEVSAKRLLLFLVTDAPEEQSPARWPHGQGEAGAGGRLAPRRAHPHPDPLL